MPILSVVIPTYNRAQKITKALNSLRHQTFTDWEAVIVDDGSTDETKFIIEKFKLTISQPILYIEQKNQGPSVARNNGGLKASGEIIVYLDSDDTLYSSALDDIAWTLKNPNVHYGLTNHNRTIMLVNKKGEEISRKFDVSGINKLVTLEQIYNWEIKTTSSGLFHRKSLFEQGLKWCSGFWIEDLEFMMQLAVLSPSGFCHIPKVLVDYVQVYGDDGLCSNASYLDWARAFESIYKLHKNDPLMKKSSIYLDRIEKYKKLHADYLGKKAPPPYYKYFPEFFESS